MMSDKNLCVGDYLVGSTGEPNMQLHKRSLGSVHLCPVSHMFHPLPHHVIEVCLPSQSASANYQEKKPTNLCAPHECLTRHTVCTHFMVYCIFTISNHHFFPGCFHVTFVEGFNQTIVQCTCIVVHARYIGKRNMIIGLFVSVSIHHPF